MVTHGRIHTALKRASASVPTVMLVAACIAGGGRVHAAAKTPPEMIDVAILTPGDAVALNAATLEIQARASARRAGRSDDDVWSGWLRVDLAIDGVLAQTLDPTVCRGQVVAGFRVSLAGLAPGAHVATVTASKKTRGVRVGGSASTTFVLDPTLPIKEPNRIEDAATPTPFACLSTPDFDTDDDDRGDDFDFRFATMRGSFVPNALSAGIDLRRDRVVLAIDDQVVAIEPGSFVCRARNRCRFTDRTGGLVRTVRLEKKRSGRWTFTIATRHRPWSARTLVLRIGANWGGLDYVHDQYVAALAPALDAGHRASATIGSGGGIVRTTDAAGVIITLTVPPGALTADTALTMTPLASSPLVNAAGALSPGVNFEPDGLQFAGAATLSFDFSATTIPMTGQDAIHLLTSPLTKVPLYGTVDSSRRVVTAEIHHFSTYDPSAATPAFEDLKAWADPILIAGGNLSFTELETLVALARDEMAVGCTANCIDLERVSAILSAEIAALVATACPADAASPTENLLNRWLKLDALAQSFGTSAPGLRSCEHRVLAALITQASNQPAPLPANVATIDITNDPALVLLKRLLATAQALAFTDLQTQALLKWDQTLTKLAQMVLTKGHSQDGTPNEAATRAAAVTALTNESALVVTVFADVLRVDAGLPAAIQLAIDSLSGPAMTVALSGGGGEAAVGSGCVTGDPGYVSRFGAFAVGTMMPASMTLDASCAAGGTSHFSIVVTAPAPNAVTWAFAGSTAGGRYQGSARVDLSMQRAGTLTIQKAGLALDVYAELPNAGGTVDYVGVAIGAANEIWSAPSHGMTFESETLTIPIEPGAFLRVTIGIGNTFGSLDAHGSLIFTAR